MSAPRRREEAPHLNALPFSSTTYEVTEEQLRNSLQNIFRVQLPRSAQAQSSFLELPDLLAASAEVTTTTTDHCEMASDILTEVILKMANGGTWSPRVRIWRSKPQTSPQVLTRRECCGRPPLA